MNVRFWPALGTLILGVGALAIAQEQPADPDPGLAGELQPPAAEESQPLAEAEALVEKLGNESFDEREAATKALWKLGEAALDALREGMQGDDPEVDYRASMLLRRIQTGITPDSPPKVVELVQRYYRSDPEGKKEVFKRLNGEQAFEQVLRMFYFEEDEKARAACFESAEKAVLPAVLARLTTGQLDEGEKLLRLAPQTDANLRSLAALLRMRGSLDDELAATKDAINFEDGQVAADSMEVAALRLALLRSAGRVTEARALAEKLGKEDVVASLALLEGDPIPYLTWFMDRDEETPIVRVYAETVLKRWKGEQEAADKLMRNVAEVAEAGGEEQRKAILALLLNGYLDLALPLIEKVDEDSAFAFYETVEQPQKALALTGYAGDAEAKKAWLAERLKEIEKDWNESDKPRFEVLTLASFLQTRGESEEARKLVLALTDLAAAEGNETWFEFIGRMSDFGSSLYELGFIAAAERLGDDDEDGEAARVVGALFREGDTAPRLWRQLENLEERAGKRLLMLGGLYGVVHVDDEKLQTTLRKLDKAAEDGNEAARTQLYVDLLEAAEARDDAGHGLALLEKLSEQGAPDEWTKKLASYYTYVAEWDKAVGEMEKILEDEPDNWHYLALWGGTKVRAGDAKEGSEALDRVETIILDDPGRLRAFAIAVEQTGATEEAARLWRQLLTTASPRNDYYWIGSTGDFAKHAKLGKNWRVAAALSEVNALRYIKSQSTYPNPASYLRPRCDADLFRGLAFLEEGDRDAAVALFQRCFDLLNGDASLADDYFPLLREAGVTELHDRNFEAIYARMEESIEAFPKAHNTYNSAAWLASRAARQLDDALAKARTALEMRPRQAAYLDTMAEVWFAKRDRAKAVEWSTKALRDSFHGGYSIDNGVGLREQYDRFVSGEFPVP